MSAFNVNIRLLKKLRKKNGSELADCFKTRNVSELACFGRETLQKAVIN